MKIGSDEYMRERGAGTPKGVGYRRNTMLAHGTELWVSWVLIVHGVAIIVLAAAICNLCGCHRTK